MFKENLVKVLHKSNLSKEWNNHLQSIWSGDKSRPWDIYSKETFRRFWDDRYSVDLDVGVRSR